MQYESILFENTDGVAVITLNRPDKLNSFTVAMHLEVRDALDKIAADPRGGRRREYSAGVRHRAGGAFGQFR